MEILFNGERPTQKVYFYSVQDNNNADELVFVIAKEQEDISLSMAYTPYIKIQDAGKSYIDKDVFDSIEENETQFALHYFLKRKSTQFRTLQLQVQFEESEEDVVWQTEIVNLNLFNTIKADAFIENNNASVINELLHRVEELERKVEALENGEI